MSDDPQIRCGIIALIGAPNAGKSTLLNRLVGQKLAIISPKPQTTRATLRGIVLEGVAQMIFIDTPGLFLAKKTLERAMVGAALSGLKDCDLALVIVDAADKKDRSALWEALAKTRKPVWLVVNKVDSVAKDELLPLVKGLTDAYAFEKSFMISALNGDGVQDLRQSLAAAMPEGPFLYDADQVTDMPSRVMAAEITREQLYLQLEQELPYEATVETESWESFEDGSAKIQQIIYVSRDGHKGIVIGKGGERLKAIGAAARKEMKQAFGHDVHLFLHIKVKPDWQDKAEFYQSRGLEFKK